MRRVKKVEVVISSVQLPKVLRLFGEKGISGYTVIDGVKGKGERGERRGDDVTDVFHNSYVMTACSEEQVSELVEAVRPLLERYGGVCLVSDAQWIVH